MSTLPDRMTVLPDSGPSACQAYFDPARGEHGLRRWAGFALGLICLVLFIFVIAPWIQQWGPVETVHAFIRERDMDATPLFYTESEEFSVAQRHMLDAARYAPHAD
ncbi:MAG: hypothetical protein ABIK28_25475 [Planctomycetota bacterium]